MTDEEAIGPNYRVRALMRGLALLASFGPSVPELSLGELAERTGLDKATALRLLDCLVHERFLARDTRRAVYTVGARALEVAAGYRAPDSLLEASDGPLHELARASNHTAALAIMDRGELLQIAVANPDRALRHHTSVGERFPFYCTSLGKALVAWWDDAEIEALIREQAPRPVTERTLVDPDALRADLAATRGRGFSFDDEEFAVGVRCMAAAIRDYAGRPIAAINISGPSAEFDGDYFDRHGQLVTAAAEEISRRLGYQRQATARVAPTNGALPEPAS